MKVNEKKLRLRLRGLTLVELLVAMALMTVLTGTIIFIFGQAQDIYAHVDAKVKVYQNARYALDAMERDLANVVRTSDMDFFVDGTPKNGHFDAGEELNGGQGIDGCEERVLARPPYTLSVTSPPNNYHYAFTLRQPKYYTATFDGKQHARDSIYFKTITQYNGQTCAAIVEFALVDADKERPRLVKRLWRVTGIDAANNRLQINDDASGGTAPKETDLCHYVTDVKFQIFVKNNRKGEDPGDKFTPGTFYTAQELVDSKVDPVTNLEPFPAFRNYWDGGQNQAAGSGNYMVMCQYDRAHAVSGDDPGIFTKFENGLFHTQTEFGFPMLTPGDKIYIYSVSPNNAVQPNDYTIKNWRLPPAGFVNKHIEFMERIPTTAPAFPAQADCAYRAGWLPPAVRVTLKIKDERAKEIRTISRTFKVLASN